MNNKQIKLLNTFFKILKEWHKLYPYNQIEYSLESFEEEEGLLQNTKDTIIGWEFLEKLEKLTENDISWEVRHFDYTLAIKFWL